MVIDPNIFLVVVTNSSGNELFETNFVETKGSGDE